MKEKNIPRLKEKNIISIEILDKIRKSHLFLLVLLIKLKNNKNKEMLAISQIAVEFNFFKIILSKKRLVILYLKKTRSKKSNEKITKNNKICLFISKISSNSYF